MSAKKAKELLNKYKEGKCTDREKAIVEQWLFQFNDTEIDLSEKGIEIARKRIGKSLPLREKKVSFLILLPRIAAAVLLLVTFSSLYLFKKKQSIQKVAENQQHDVAPGRNQATLILSNGKKIILTKGLNGALARQGGTVVQVTKGNNISYIKGALTDDTVVSYNTLSTSRGEQSPYPLILSDGSKVWLNAASSITFPTAFSGKERSVTITGEAYFEIAHNASKPFKVTSNGQIVEVLGTHFNVNAYSDEDAIKTTLVEGSVKVSSENGSSIIKPGEQAQFKNGRFNVVNADMDEVLAWKNGFFYFKDNTIEEVMRQFARWYDVDVKYGSNLPAREFSGQISKNVNASQILDILNFENIHFKIEGKTIIVTQ